MLQDLLFPGIICLAIASDMVSMRIRNPVVASLVVGYFLLAPMYGVPLAEIAGHGLTGLFALVICFILFASNVIGGGDAKLIAATVLWIGSGPVLVQYLILAAIYGGALALITIGVRELRLGPGISSLLPVWLTCRGKGIPYGVALGSAALWVYPQITFI